MVTIEKGQFLFQDFKIVFPLLLSKTPLLILENNCKNILLNLKNTFAIFRCFNSLPHYPFATKKRNLEEFIKMWEEIYRQISSLINC